ncbi:MAG: division/cell wall cluster transcriptional repressor MraZ [Candidatus Sumerlaeia bacterium]|nr:division/cell wall cluster transcriptional repressor MraZ [Candidatus Sumerlaeia bacterium]
MANVPRFFGTARAMLDDKGRLTIPAKIKEQLLKDPLDVNRVVVTTWWDDCLALYTTSQWEKYSEVIANLPEDNPDNRRLQANIFGHTESLELDKSNRILIPADLRREGGIDPEVRELILVGSMDRVLIWDAAKGTEYQRMSKDERSKLFQTARAQAPPPGGASTTGR